MRVSQSDLADYLGVAQATLSQATSNGHKCKGQPVRAWAIYDAEGRVSGYEVPNRAMREIGMEGSTGPGDELPELSILEKVGSDGSGLASATQSRENPQEPADNSTNVSLLPRGQDYFRPASSGGAAYVVGKAIEEDNATAHGAVMVAGGGIGALIGWLTSDESAGGAAIGAIGGGLLAWVGMNLDVDGEATPSPALSGRRRQTKSLNGRSGHQRRSGAEKARAAPSSRRAAAVHLGR